MRWPSSYVVFDFETTGLSPEADRIIQVGLCEVVNRRVQRQAGWLVNQSIEVPPDATEIHGIRTADIRARGVPPEKSLDVLLQTMRKAPTCIGHNIHRFDVPFLIAECDRLAMEPPACEDFIDTAALFKGWKLGMPKEPGESHQEYADRVVSIRVAGLRYSIKTCVGEFGIELDASTLHDASRDAAGEAMRMAGARLDYDATRPDEGLFLVAADDSETRVEQVFTNEPAQLGFLMPADASGPYVVLIRRRHPRGHGPLLEGRLSEPIVPA